MGDAPNVPTTGGPARDPLLGQVIGDRYRVVRRLGSGGMATLYVAQHTLIGRMVALKILHAEFAKEPDNVKRFIHEGRAAGTLGHPNIVASTDMGYTAAGAPFLVLELLDGLSLGAEVERVGPMTVERAGQIGVQIASALQAAHDHGIIHRDLKPDNVFLVDNEGHHDQVKILDFGISKFTSPENSLVTQAGTLMGTPDFMAPEQIATPGKVDHRVDVYALGAILYHVLSGTPPYAGRRSRRSW